MSAYADAGYGDPGRVETIVSQARSTSEHVAGRVIRNFVVHFSRD